MKKLFPLVMAVLLSGVAMGQNSFGIKGGLNVAKIKLSLRLHKTRHEMRAGHQSLPKRTPLTILSLPHSSHP